MRYAEARVRSEVFRALSHPARLLMLDALSRGDCSGADIRKLIKISQSNISRHAAQLKRVGLVTDRRDGMGVVYRLKPSRMEQTMDFAATVLQSDLSNRLALLKRTAPPSA